MDNQIEVGNICIPRDNIGWMGWEYNEDRPPTILTIYFRQSPSGGPVSLTLNGDHALSAWCQYTGGAASWDPGVN